MLNYLQGTSDMGLHYPASKNWELTVAVDASYKTGSKGKSITGYLILVNGTAVAWRTCQQKIVATSAATAEYIALYEALSACYVLMKIANELGKPFALPVKVEEDNAAVISVLTGRSSTKMVKSLPTKYYWVEDAITQGLFKLKFTPTAEQIADGMTKALPREGVRKLRDGIGLKQRNTLNKTVTRNAFVAKSGGPLSALSDLTASTSGRRKQRCVCLETNTNY